MVSGIFRHLHPHSFEWAKWRIDHWEMYLTCVWKHTHTYTHTTILQLCVFCPGQPGWAGIRRNIHPLTLIVVNHPYLLSPSTTIHGILPIQSTCFTVFFHNLSPSFLWSASWPGTLHFILHTFFHPIIIATHAHTIATCFTVVPRLCNLNLVSLSTLYSELYLVTSHHTHDLCVKSWKYFRTDSISLNSVYHSLSDDIVRFKIEVGLEEKCTKTLTVNTRKMVIARLQRLTLLSWPTLTGLLSVAGWGSILNLTISSKPMGLCDALFSNYFEDLFLLLALTNVWLYVF